ncbi:MAG: IclR family transcriptional regulator [Hyphomicrobiales bacterium]
MDKIDRSVWTRHMDGMGESNSSPQKSTPANGIQVIARAAEILRVLKNDNSGLSLGRIAERVGLPRSTVQRIVNALVSQGFVMTTAAEGGLRLGPEIQSLAAAGRIDVAELIRPMLAELARKTGETVDLAVFRTDHMVFVDQAVGTQRLRTVSAVGETFPMITTANGKAVLAMLDDELAASLTARALKTDDAPQKTLSEIIAQIEEIRESGLAWDFDEHTDGISAVGMAFTEPSGMVYALSIPVPSHRFSKSKDRLAHLLSETVKKITSVLD